MSGKACCICAGSSAISPFINCSWQPTVRCSPATSKKTASNRPKSAISSYASSIISICVTAAVSFITLSGQRAELAIPQLTWLNEDNRHRAEGEVNLSSLTGQHGVMQVRMDLRDDTNGLLNNGRVWLQADDVDVKPVARRLAAGKYAAWKAPVSAWPRGSICATVRCTRAICC